MKKQPLWCCFDGFVLRLRLLVASVPGSPAGGRDGACLLLDHVVRCSSASGAVVQVLASWGPLLVPGSFDSPADEILSFEVVVEWFSSSHCWSHIPLMLCASTGIYFLSILASSRLSFVWVFGGLVQVFSCLALSVPVEVRSGFAPADFSSLWFCLVERI